MIDFDKATIVVGYPIEGHFIDFNAGCYVSALSTDRDEKKEGRKKLKKRHPLI